MVEFYDPITKENKSYYIAKEIRAKWKKVRNGQLVKDDDDRVYIVDGRERTGKSVFTLQQAKYLDPTFNVDRVCFTPEAFLYQIRHAPKGSVVVFDEAFRGLSSKGTQSKVNKKIVQAMMEMGQRNLIIFIVLPTFFLLEIYAAVLRSNALFHIYRDKKGIRKWRVYNYQEKSILYQVGKKRGLSYSFPKARIRGRFYGKYPIDEQKYRDKKLKSLQEDTEAMEEPIKDEKGTHLFCFYLFDLGKSVKEVGEILKNGGKEVSQRQLYNIKDKWKKKKRLKEEKLLIAVE